MDTIFSDEFAQHIFEKGIEENNKNNPFECITLLFLNFINVFRKLCNENNLDYEKIISELADTKELKGFFYVVSYALRHVCPMACAYWKSPDTVLLRRLQQEDRTHYIISSVRFRACGG